MLDRFTGFLIRYTVEDVEGHIEEARFLSKLKYNIPDGVYILCSTSNDEMVTDDEYQYYNLCPEHCYILIAIEKVLNVE